MVILSTQESISAFSKNIFIRHQKNPSFTGKIVSLNRGRTILIRSISENQRIHKTSMNGRSERKFDVSLNTI